MTTLQVSLPDGLAQAAQAAGIFEPQAMTQLVQAELARREANRFFESIGKMHAVRGASITPEVIASEIKAYRAERRALGA
ncbi:MAG: hypothetical protein QM533_06600 [Cytophagales bacterium]|jgi:hypothetical protein|nr:hypothetical protein [Cytophagales bacterium]